MPPAVFDTTCCTESQCVNLVVYVAGSLFKCVCKCAVFFQEATKLFKSDLSIFFCCLLMIADKAWITSCYFLTRDALIAGCTWSLWYFQSSCRSWWSHVAVAVLGSRNLFIASEWLHCVQFNWLTDIGSSANLKLARSQVSPLSTISVCVNVLEWEKFKIRTRLRIR